jgi:4-amino-4-deoxy-L-arabinose transferase-like glycosyltransferase
MSTTKYRILFFGVLAFALLVRVLHLGGFYLDDAFPYSQLAHQIADGTYSMTADAYYSMRIFFILPLGACVSLFGDNPVGYFILPLSANLAAIALTMRMARRLGETTALLTGIVLACTPIMVLWATIPHPDAMTPFWWALFCTLLFDGREATTPMRQRLLFVFSGFAIGLSFYNRIFSPGILLVVPLLMLADRRFSFSYLWLLPGLGLAMLLGNGTYFLGSGDFFLRSHSTATKISWEITESGWAQRPTSLDPFRSPGFMYLRSFFSPGQQLDWAFLFFGALGGTLYAIRNKIEGIRLPLTWLAAAVLLFDGVLAPLVFFPFTFNPYILGACLPAAILFATLLARAPQPPLRLLLIGALGCLPILLVLVWLKWRALVIAAHLLLTLSPLPNLIFLSTLALAAVLLPLYFRNRLEQAWAFRSIPILVFCIVGTLFTLTKSNLNTRDYGSVLRGQGGIAQAVQTYAQDDVFYLSPKYRPKLILFYWFKTSYRYKQPLDDWTASANGKTLHFSLLPPKAEDLASGDCVLLYKPYLDRYRRTGAGAHPDLVALGYQYPHYALTPPTQWELVYEDWENLLYRVTNPSAGNDIQ